MNSTLSKLNARLTSEDVDKVFEILLGRPNGDPADIEKWVSTGGTLGDFMIAILNSDERKNREALSRLDRPQNGNYLEFRAPTHLQVVATDIKQVLIVGSCFSDRWAHLIRQSQSSIQCEVYGLGQLPEQPLKTINEYDFQIIQIPLRSILPDAAFAKLSNSDTQGHQNLFDHASNMVRMSLNNAMQWNKSHGILTFVLTFIVPQQNLVGRLLPRYDLRNPVYFIEKLNEILAQELNTFSNSYLVDINEVFGSHGKRLVQEDAIAQFNHGSVIYDWDYGFDQHRLEKTVSAIEHFQANADEIIMACWHEVFAMFRTIRQLDAVKLVVIDLDDTLWRGVIAEAGSAYELPTSEGWPKALWETLLILKRRGILLAIISKNEESRVLEIWDSILDNQLKMSDFAIHRINWKPKSENMAEILTLLNLLPQNVLFIDDNPLQRSEMTSAFPDIRTLGGAPVLWRHILLLSPETQVANITPESTSRTEMVQAQVLRETNRNSFSAQDFLANIGVKLTIFKISDNTDPRFARVFELLNKTNQFNTTGRRWLYEEFAHALSEGMSCFGFDVSDKYTSYGIVGILLVQDNTIIQFVMSCRIMGLEAEVAVVACIVSAIRSNRNIEIFAALVETDRNLPCRDVYTRCGFLPAPGGYFLPSDVAAPMPNHVETSSTDFSIIQMQDNGQKTTA